MGPTTPGDVAYLQNANSLHRINTPNPINQIPPPSNHRGDLLPLRGRIPLHHDNLLHNRTHHRLLHAAQRDVGGHAQCLEFDGGVVYRVLLGKSAFQGLGDFGAEFGVFHEPSGGLGGHPVEGGGGVGEARDGFAVVQVVRVRVRFVVFAGGGFGV